MNYFEDEANWNAAVAVIDSWRGTPYRHLWMQKGRGADCSLFIGAILQELGVVTKVEFDFYPADWYAHTQTEAVKSIFAMNIERNMAEGFDLSVLFKDTPVMRGDIPSFSTSPTGVTNHVGMLLDPPRSFVNSIQRRGVSNMEFGNYWRDRITSIYRVVKNVGV